MNLYERNQKQRTFFNEKIDTYDDVHVTYMDTKKTLGNSLDKDTKKILDLGAGTGLELIYVFELFPSAEVTVIDITENMLEELKKRNIYVRYFKKPRIDNYLRITIGTKEEMEQLMNALQEILQEV